MNATGGLKHAQDSSGEKSLWLDLSYDATQRTTAQISTSAEIDETIQKIREEHIALIFTNQPLGDEGAIQLVTKLKDKARLISINLSGNQITPTAYSLIYAILFNDPPLVTHSLNSLTYLTIDGKVCIDGVAGARLSQALGCLSALFQNKITDLQSWIAHGISPQIFLDYTQQTTPNLTQSNLYAFLLSSGMEYIPIGLINHSPHYSDSWSYLSSPHLRTRELLTPTSGKDQQLLDKQIRQLIDYFCGKPLLHLAAIIGNISAIDYLVRSAKVDPNGLDQHYCTPLQNAVASENLPAIKTLLQLGALQQTHPRSELPPPLFIAISAQNTEIVSLLTQRGPGQTQPPIDTEAQVTHQGFTFSGSALDLAALTGQKEIAQYLIQQGANPNQTSANHRKIGTPLHAALWGCRYGDRTEIIQTLIQKGANLTLTDGRQRTPYDLAWEKMHTPPVVGKDRNEQTRSADALSYLSGSSSSAEVEAVTLPPPSHQASSSSGSREENTKAPLDFSELLIPHTDLALGEPLGRGSFGEVKKATWVYEPVAVKTLHLGRSVEEQDAFKQEIGVMMKLKSMYVVHLRAVTIDPYSIVMEYLPRGSLADLLHNPKEPMPWGQRHQLASDIAKGLAFLHHHRVYHRDLKSDNVLLTETGQAKLSDFGLSQVKISSSRQQKSGSVGTPCWMAPEVMDDETNKTPYQSASDIYSYAMVVWELCTRKTPYAGLTTGQLYIRVVVKQGREEVPTEAPRIFQEVITRCWAHEPGERPTAPQMVEHLAAHPVREADAPSGAPKTSGILPNSYSQRGAPRGRGAASSESDMPLPQSNLFSRGGAFRGRGIPMPGLMPQPSGGVPAVTPSSDGDAPLPQPNTVSRGGVFRGRGVPMPGLMPQPIGGAPAVTPSGDGDAPLPQPNTVSRGGVFRGRGVPMPGLMPQPIGGAPAVTPSGDGDAPLPQPNTVSRGGGFRGRGVPMPGLMPQPSGGAPLITRSSEGDAPLPQPSVFGRGGPGPFRGSMSGAPRGGARFCATPT